MQPFTVLVVRLAVVAERAPRRGAFGARAIVCRRALRNAGTTVALPSCGDVGLLKTLTLFSRSRLGQHNQAEILGEVASSINIIDGAAGHR